MNVLSIAIIIFIILESLNVVTLYFNPGSRMGNGLGVFNAWESSKADPEMHQFIRYLVNWVAGTKLIFIALLIVILLTAGESTQLLTVVAMIASISSFFWRLFPNLGTYDREFFRAICDRPGMVVDEHVVVLINCHRISAPHY